MTEIAKPKYAWLIFIGCCCCGAGGMALTISLLGVYLIPASQGMGISPTEFTMWSSMLGIAQLFSFPIFGQLMKKHFTICYLIGVILEALGIFLFSVLDTMLGMCFIGILLGIALPMTFFLPIPTLTSNWFAPKYRGTMLGIATAFSGVGTFIWSPLFTTIIGAVGYQNCYIVNAILALVLLLPWVFVFKFSPEEKGLKPWGWTAADDNPTNAEAGLTTGMSAAKALKQPAFWLLFVAVAFCAIGMGFNNTQRPMAAEMLHGAEAAAMIGAWMISIAAAGNVIGKLLFGVIADKTNLRITTIIFAIAFFLCFVFWLVFPGELWAMYVGAFLLGTHNGIASVGLPRIARKLFGGADYAKIWARLSMASALVGGFSSTIVTALAAGIGTYVGIKFVGLGMILVVVVTVFALLAMAYMGKLKFDIKDAESKAA